MNAQISSCRTGERRVQELVEKFGVETFEAAVDEILDHGERLTRSRLANLPKGTWTAVDYADDDGIDRDTLVKIQATVTVTDDEVLIDFAGIAPRDRGPDQHPDRVHDRDRRPRLQGADDPRHAGERGQLPAAPRRGAARLRHARGAAGADLHALDGAARGRRRDEGVRAGNARRHPGLLGRRHLQRHGRGVHPQTGKVWLESSNEESASARTPAATATTA